MNPLRRSCLAVLLAAALPAQVTVLFDGSWNGHLEGCDCPSNPKSGLVKRLAWIESRRAENPKGVLLFSSGDWLDPYPDPKAAEAVLKAAKIAKYDAVIWGDQDFSQGVSVFKKLQKTAPGVVANAAAPDWVSAKDTSAWRVLPAGAGKVAVVGLLGPQVFRYSKDKALKEAMKIEDAEKSLERLIPELKKSAEYGILLTHQGLDADLRLSAAVRRFGFFRLILGGHSQDLTTAPAGDPEIPVFHAGPNGNFQLELVLDRRGAVQSARYHFFQYPDGVKPIQETAIRGDAEWKFPLLIHKNPPDDARVRAVLNDFYAR